MSNDLSQLKTLLQQRVEQMRRYARPDRRYCCFEELVLDCGVVMVAATKPPKKLKRGLPKSCYYNAQKIAFGGRGLTYVEGYALSADIPMAIAHAWLANDKGEAIDPTWEPPGVAYLGIPFETAWVKAFLKARNRENELSIFEGNHFEKFSLLQNGIPQEAIAPGVI